MRLRIDRLLLDTLGQPAIHLRCPAAVRPAPGQFALAVENGDREPTRRALFPTRFDTQGFTAALPDGADWSPGVDLDTWTPVGIGFSPPVSAKRWLLAAIDVPTTRLLPLIDMALERAAAVALSAPQRPAELDPSVEFLVDLREALSWADFLAVDLGPADGPGLLQRLAGPIPRAAQALITPPMPCGLGVCGACAIGSRRHELACVDGPVFDLRRLGLTAA